MKVKPTAASSYYGLTKLSLQLIDFDLTGTLTVDFSSFTGSTIQTVSLYGKDQSSLSYLTKTVDGRAVAIQLTQATAYQSPVLTGVGITWA